MTSTTLERQETPQVSGAFWFAAALTRLAARRRRWRCRADLEWLGERMLRDKQEIGHLRGNAAAHFVFDKALWSELKAAGRIVDHPVFPGRVGPAARRIGSEDDVRDVIALLRLNYERTTASRVTDG